MPRHPIRRKIPRHRNQRRVRLACKNRLSENDYHQSKKNFKFHALAFYFHQRSRHVAYINDTRRLGPLDLGPWTLDFRLWTFDFGPWTLDLGLWTLDFRLWTLACEIFAHRINSIDARIANSGELLFPQNVRLRCQCRQLTPNFI